MAEESITERAQRQGERLAALRQQTGISKGLLMDRLGFKTSRAYDLYEDGTSVIRLDRTAAWASAFGLSEEAFVAYLLGHRSLRTLTDEPYDMASDLRGHIPEDDIPDFVAKYAAMDPADQRSAADGAKRMANRARDATKRSNQGA